MFKARVEDLAEALLHTDVDAIAANDTHIVLTVRVSRAFLLKNHNLLADLSDFASGADLPQRQADPLGSDPPPARSPAPSRSRLRLIAVVAGVAAAFSVGLCLPQIHLARSGRALAHQILPSAGATEPR